MFSIYITFIISSGVPPSTSEPPLRRNPQLEFSPSRLISITETFSLFLRFPIMFVMVVLLFFSKICHCTISRFWRPIWKVAGRCFAHLFWAEKKTLFFPRWLSNATFHRLLQSRQLGIYFMEEMKALKEQTQIFTKWNMFTKYQNRNFLRKIAFLKC